MGPQQSRMTQRSARATSTLPHDFFEAPGAMLSRCVPCPGRREVLCRVCCVAHGSPCLLPLSGSLFSVVHSKGWVEVKRTHLCPRGKPGLPPTPSFLPAKARSAEPDLAPSPP